jgi:SAM-dependent methyltransferase
VPTIAPPEPPDAAAWDDDTAAFRAGRDRTWRAHCDALHRGLIEAWLPPATGRSRALKTDLFDEATGEGLASLLRERGHQVHGIDVSLGVVRAAHDGGAVVATRADVRALPFGRSSFEVAVSNSTLDHFPRIAHVDRALRELHRVVRPGGVLIVTMDNLANPLLALRALVPDRWRRGSGLVPYYVGRTVTGPGLRAHVEAAGFAVDRTTTLMHVPRVAAVPWCARADRRGRSFDPVLMQRLLRWEHLGRLPTRAATGHFVGVRAVRR